MQVSQAKSVTSVAENSPGWPLKWGCRGHREHQEFTISALHQTGVQSIHRALEMYNHMKSQNFILRTGEKMNF